MRIILDQIVDIALQQSAKQEDGVVQGLLGDGVSVETGEERVPADDQRGVRVG